MRNKRAFDYVELRFSPWFMAEPHALKPEAVVGGYRWGRERGARFGMRKFDRASSAGLMDQRTPGGFDALLRYRVTW
jgi:hypothetical protein